MSCGDGTNGKTKYFYTGGQVGFQNQTGFLNFVSGGGPSAGLSAGTTIGVFFSTGLGRRPWLDDNAKMSDQLLDNCYPIIGLRWTAEIELTPDIILRVSDQPIYVTDKDGTSHFYDARAEKAPSITVDSGEWLSQAYKVSDLQLTLNNRDGHYNTYLPSGDLFRQWTGAKVTIKVGFGEDGTNYFTLFVGHITNKQGIETTRDSLLIRAYDRLQIDEVPFPPRVFGADIYPSIQSQAAGKPIPVVYGDWTTNIDDWGNVPAVCTNGAEVGPQSYNFKISDAALGSLQSAFLHRGDRAAGKPLGPIHVARPAISIDLDAGEFNLDPSAPVLDEAQVILQGTKCAAGTTNSSITSDGATDFLALGIKAGDVVVHPTAQAASVIKGNLEFISLLPGILGNALSVALVQNAPDNTADQTKCTVSVSGGNFVTVGIPTSLDDLSNVIIGADTAADIRTAIYTDPTASTLLRVKIVGTVPAGPPYDQWSRPSSVHQSTFGQSFLTTGNAAPQYSRVLSVNNFSMTIDNNATYATDTEYSVETVQYTFSKDDKFSVVCTGKPLPLLSTTRLAAVNTGITLPSGLSVAFDQTYWLADNATQTIYNLSFSNEIISSIPFTSIRSGLTQVSSVSVGSDNRLWIADPAASTIYQYDQNTGAVALTIPTSSVPGVGVLANLTGISVQPDNRVWIVDQSSGEFYLVSTPADAPNVPPSLVRSFNKSAFNSSATNILDLSYDFLNSELTCVDRATNAFYRLNQTNGHQISSQDLTSIVGTLTFCPGVSVCQDGTLFFLDGAALAIYNYSEASYTDGNPAYIARDLLQGYGGHTVDEFDLDWQRSAAQLQNIKARLVIDKTTTLITYLNLFLRQFNIVFSLRFNKFSLFWITFSNFTTSGKLVTEKDIKEESFKPQKEVNQYFNTATATYAYKPFDATTTISDTYVSAAGISFAGQEINRKLDLSAMYQRTDIDKIVPLMVRLAVPEPEFITVTFGFRLIRSQIHNFLKVSFFDDQVDPKTGMLRVSGRRFDNIPCMVRSMKFDLAPMTIEMKLWSLGATQFTGYTPTGNFVGGQFDKITLSNLGRLGRVSATGTITDHGPNNVTLATADGQNAEHRSGDGGLAWAPGYKVDLVHGDTKAVYQTLTIASVSGAVVTFTENIADINYNTVKNGAGFITGGYFLQYSHYQNLTEGQKGLFASFGKPEANYPTSQSQEIADQRSGVEAFADGGVPYVLYPAAFTFV